ncbi:hypothetical protein KC207_10660 [Phycicoccus sp. BSK3Z-2]|uniref:Uncharacterized protein n=1 Tax=Phycicoccus avicenniae TaxID=2828860 RepID=A0A941I0B7_9MICO|nr:hypothetical protein [Phycicoccus avicenniae]MBR7743750.1 hypothetical protein [Phycicoccus avicenniae]
MALDSRTVTTLAVVVAALAAAVSAPVLSGDTTDPPAVSAPATAADDETTSAPPEVSPFAQDEVVFRHTPSWGALLLGRSDDVSARGLWRAGCDDAGGDELVAVHRSARTAVKTVVPETSDTTEGLYPCPVTLTIPATVGDSPGGWLVAARDGTPAVGADVTESLTAFRIARVMGPDAYGLLALSAAVVALVAAGIGSRRRRRRTAWPSVANAPVVSAVLGALTAVSAGTFAFSGLAPGLDLGGVLVLGLVGALLVAVGQAMSTTARKVGGAVSVIGMAVIALLLPLVLLHAATVGSLAWLAWLLVVALLGIAVGLGPDAEPAA